MTPIRIFYHLYFTNCIGLPHSEDGFNLQPKHVAAVYSVVQLVRNNLVRIKNT
jgi:hypothetical protein